MGEDDCRRFGHRPTGRLDDSIQYCAVRLGDGRELRRRTNANASAMANGDTDRDPWSDGHPGADARTADAVPDGMQPRRPAMSSRLSSADEHAAAANADEDAGAHQHAHTDSDALSPRMRAPGQPLQVLAKRGGRACQEVYPA